MEMEMMMMMKTTVRSVPDGSDKHSLFFLFKFSQENLDTVSSVQPVKFDILHPN